MDNQKEFYDLLKRSMEVSPEGYMKSYSGLATFFRAKYRPDWDSGAPLDIALVGIPSDLGLTQRTGARHGPREIRNQSSNILYCNSLLKMTPFGQLAVADIGDALIPSAFDLERVVTEIESTFRRLYDRNISPVAAGGDDSVTYPILKALGQKTPLGVVHIDSHLDLAEDINGTRLHHGGPFISSCKEGFIDPKRTVHIAIRDPYAMMETYGDEVGMTTIDINRFYELGVDGVAAEARSVVGTGPVYISFDIDALDPAFAPGTGTPVVGGITSYEAKRLLHGLRGPNIVGADLVEVSPPFDSARITALAGAQLMFELLCLVALRRSR
ncbi:MAG: agmatinase [Acetobacteraceae bacterium]